MSRQSQLSPDNILRFLQLRNGPASLEDLSRSLQVRRSSRRALLQMLAKLKKRGLVEELSHGRFLLHQTPRPQQPSSKPRANPEAPADKFPQQKAFSRDEIKGRLVLHQDGYGFVVPDVAIPNLDGDLFIPRDFVEDAMHGDHVIAKISRLSGATGARRAEGRILRIVSRAHPSVVGLFRYTSRGCVVVPYDPRVQHDIDLPAGEELSPALREQLLPGEKERAGKRLRLPHIAKLDGAVVNAELVRYAREGASPIGRVIEILGRPGDLGVDTEIIIRKHHLPHTFPGEVAHEAEQLARPVSESDLSGREDFRSLPIVTIDGETARDFDDAVYVERLEGGGWLLQVHIADVAHYVTPESPLDREARLRGNSVYFLDRAVPMLPEALSNGMCSLKPREERLVLSAIMQFDSSGRMLNSRMTPGVIRSAERMTYTNVNKVLEGDAEMSARYAHLTNHFRAMKGLALLLNARRAENGSIDFDLPEPVIEFDDQQQMTNIGRSERNIAHRLIEEFMLAANRAVAHYLIQRGLHTLHRVHEKPDARKVLEFEELARAFGYSMGVEDLHQREVAVRHGKVPSPAKSGRPDSRGHGRERQMRAVLPASDITITPQHYQRLVQKLSGKPEERILSYLMLRSLKQARYSAEPVGHFALGFDEYTHFTSPIRRYPDLIVHRILKWALANPNAPAPTHIKPAVGTEVAVYSLKHLEEIAAETSETERRAAGAERELISWKTAQFMEQHLGDEYEALIISVQKYGCFVELFEVFVEGLLPITAIEEAADARCVYRERDHAIVAVSGGDSGRGRRSTRRKSTLQLTWKLGDRIRVRAERIDPIRRRVEFALVSS
ncbi:MAG TPA: RNB domain-containing ribonuclease [Candidatus Sulfotelmatobacter sp.]|jgi:ribonuclease R|nr:RNB domain-containing ribonuclease [Candidatus Sulfotelmatobacter sp.]